MAANSLDSSPHRSQNAAEGHAEFSVDTTLPPSISRYLRTRTVPVRVGRDVADSPQTFHLHSGLLILNSAYFAAALKGGRWSEGQQWKSEIPDIHPAKFALFAEMLYQVDTQNHSPIFSLDEKALLPVVETYVLADRFLCTSLKGKVESMFHEILDSYWTPFSYDVICDLLVIGETRLRPDSDENSISSRILSLCLNRLDELQKFDRFEAILHQYTSLGVRISMRAQPTRTSPNRKDLPRQYFKDRPEHFS